MNRKIIQLLFFSILLNISAQSITKLDTNYGFRQFKFGTDLSSFKNIKNANNKVNNMDEYIYEGNDIKSIQEVKVSRVNLYFFNSKLAAIAVDFGWNNNYTEADYKQVNYGLETSFGKSPNRCVGQENTLNCDIWLGKKVKLEHNRIKTATDSVIGYLIFEERDVRQKRIDLEF